MYESYGKLIAYGQKSYNNSRGDKGILEVSAIAQGKPNFKETFDKLMNERFRKFFEADNAVLPLFDGYNFKDIGSKTYSNENSRDIKAMIDDIYDFTARAFVIPPALLKGDLANTSDVVDNYLTFCIEPLVQSLGQEIIRKRIGPEAYSKGTYIKIDTKTIKHIDLLSVATSIDKLISSGAFCINDIRIAVGEEIIDEPWAWQHFMTKNYETVEAQLKALLEGGEG
jgi:HK97 family phage portal protein